MVIFLYFLCAITIVHIVYDKIILPSYRLHLRNELFIIRDSVRDIIISPQNSKQLEAAQLLHTVLNNSINRLDLLTFSNRAKLRVQIKLDRLLRRDLANKLRILQSDTQVNELFETASNINEKAFLSNGLLSALWLNILIIPIYIIIIMPSKLIGYTRDIMMMSDKQINKLVV